MALQVIYMKRIKASIRLAGIILLIFFLSGVTLLSLEGWCRFSAFHNLSFPPHLLKYDTKLGYRYNPDHQFSTAGFRGVAEARPKRKGVTRIVCLGESSTSCDMLADGSKTWPYRLEQYMNDRSREHSFEVINAAVGGYGTRHVLALCTYQIPQLSPDVVIIYLGWNGRGVFSETFRETPFNVYAPQDNILERLDKILMNHSYLYFNRIRWRIEPFLAQYRNHPEFSRLKDSSLLAAGFFEDCSAIIDSIKGINALPVMIRFPIMTSRLSMRSNDSTDHVRLLARIAGIESLARQKGAVEIDMSRLFSTDSAGQARYFFDCVHLNKYGCDAFARALADSLLVRLDKKQGE
jgi:lysophospholipase L1-like esterase